MDSELQMATAINTSSTPLVEFLASRSTAGGDISVSAIVEFRRTVTTRAAALLQSLRREYLSGSRGQTPASHLMGRTRALYEFIRRDLGVKMHGLVNHELFEGEGALEGDEAVFGEGSIGGEVSKIYEAVRDGKMRDVVASVFLSA